MAAIALCAGVASGKHANTVPDPVIEPIETLPGEEVGRGGVNLTLRQLPPQKPNAVLEQGIGRAPGYTDWERQEHRIHDNPEWYLGVGALFQPADMTQFAPRGGGPGLQTPIPVQTQIALQYIQNREAQTYPGARGDRTVALPPSMPLTRTAVLK